PASEMLIAVQDYENSLPRLRPNANLTMLGLQAFAERRNRTYVGEIKAAADEASALGDAFRPESIQGRETRMGIITEAAGLAALGWRACRRLTRNSGFSIAICVLPMAGG